MAAAVSAAYRGEAGAVDSGFDLTEGLMRIPGVVEMEETIPPVAGSGVQRSGRKLPVVGRKIIVVDQRADHPVVVVVEAESRRDVQAIAMGWQGDELGVQLERPVVG